MEKPTLADIRRVAETNRGSAPSYLNCGGINRNLRDALQDKLDIDAEFISGSVGKARGIREEHGYVHVPQAEVTDADSDVIIDGAVDQFCLSNCDEGRVDIQLGPKEDLPRVAVLTSRDTLYDKYHRDNPF